MSCSKPTAPNHTVTGQGSGAHGAAPCPGSLIRLVSLLSLALLLAGCAVPRSAQTRFDRPFTFQQDSFAYPNELVWEYHVDAASGKVVHTRREPPAQYTLHCFVVANSARQFFLHARFDPASPMADESTYRRLIQGLVSRSPRQASAAERKILIPGYANLYAFSQAHASLLKSECGGAWRSYIQRGHWRMIFPFPRRHQERMARRFLESLNRNRPPIVHIVRFPSLSINHAVLLFAAEETSTEIQFTLYDPNFPERPGRLTYRREERTFYFPPNSYFAGGRVDAYEVYHGFNY